MTVVAALFVVVCGLLVVAGAMKIVRPAPTRATLVRLRLPATRLVAHAVGLAEIGTGVTAALVGGRTGAVVAAAYLAFAAVAMTGLRTGESAPCGCFGAADVRMTWGHLLTNLLVSAVALAMAAGNGEGLTGLLDRQPLAGVPFVVLAGTAVWLLVLALTRLPVASRAATPTRSFTLHRLPHEHLAGRT